METLPYESIVAIFAFWMVVVVAFIIFIRRMTIRRANEVILRSQNTCSEPSTAQQCDSRRIIQIYYIGNLESDPNPTLITSSSHNIWNKLLTQIEEDHPPSYDEVSFNTSACSNNNNPCNELAVSSVALSKTQPEIFQQHNMSSHSHTSSETGVVVEQS